MKIFILLLLLLAIGLQYSLWLGKNGIRDFVRIKNDVAEQKIKNNELKIRNAQLFAEINDLNEGKEALEERARNDLGMIKQDEKFYRLIPESSKTNIVSPAKQLR
ncbi:cell division protein FtsB [Candidatus Hamiltonella defensa]|uniref:Cell division protein FtsB n=1 Tax=Candidatus Williamhamiltonella defendens TaxID=138072 RepID=A0AAC9YG58_9ENTR|nr:cell division protein FtsB [Candidatus Hamiltonella defensa]ASV33028.1 cell division protein FtsB [Candidatus Hamiltonella defensa]AWK15981.1 cell division protein FtsB [Candidatus Hamiltonella defensa]MBK4361651.1 cell division protein FtsB [Candidatus Hamiltonella defensa]